MAPAASRLVQLLRAVGERLQRLPRSLWSVAALLWMGLIWGLSSLHGVQRTGGVALAYPFNLGHALLFGLLAACWALSLPRAQGWPRISRAAALGVLLAVLGFGILDEWHQAHIPGREASLFDLVTNLTGAACVLWIAAFVPRGEARDGALRLRLALCVLACAAAAALATWPPVSFNPFAAL